MKGQLLSSLDPLRSVFTVPSFLYKRGSVVPTFRQIFYVSLLVWFFPLIKNYLLDNDDIDHIISEAI